MKSGFIDKTYRFLFSMRMMSAGLLVFLIAIGLATFIESNHGIQAAQIIVYDAAWFEILLLFLSLNLISNIFTYRMFRKEKIAALAFHLSFLIILLGAAITRNFSLQGLIKIEEGETTSEFYSSDPLLRFNVKNEKTGTSDFLAVRQYLSEFTHGFLNLNHFEHSLDFEEKEVSVEYLGFKEKCEAQGYYSDTFYFDKSTNSVVLEVVIEGMKSVYLGQDETITLGDIPLSFNQRINAQGVRTRNNKGKIEVSSDFQLRSLPMSEMRKQRESGLPPDDSLYIYYPVNEWSELKTTTLYQAANSQFVIKNIFTNAKKTFTKLDEICTDYLTVNVSDGKSSQKVVLEECKMGISKPPKIIHMNGLEISLEYGSLPSKFPIDIKCRDFQVEYYPGSEMASSYKSYLTFYDKNEKKPLNKEIFMNHVIDYNGYRFFQSQFLKDTEGKAIGTILEFNQDWWGTNITYLGYLLMTIGMILSLFNPNGRLSFLNKSLKKIKKSKIHSVLLIIGLLCFSNSALGQEHADHSHDSDLSQHKKSNTHHIITEAHSDELASLLVLSFKGRIIPLHTFCDEYLRKIHRGNSFTLNGKKYNAVQTIISMHLFNEFWKSQRIMYVSTALRERLSLSKYESYNNLTDKKGSFKWSRQWEHSTSKSPSTRNEFDKKILKLNERLRVTSDVFSGIPLQIIPLHNHPSNKWISYVRQTLYSLRDNNGKLVRGYADTNDLKIMFSDEKTLKMLANTIHYFEALKTVGNSKDYKECDSLLKTIKSYQREIAKDIVPSKDMVELEILYNKLEIFKWTYRCYGLFGLCILILFFVELFVDTKTKLIRSFDLIRKVFFFLLIGVFVFHASGLIILWLVADHVPWSNGYEAVVFIGWICMLAGFIFSRKNAVVVAGAAILASLMVFVTELSLLDPEITPLQPVLKSPWIKIHVAIITGSYGFLGLVCVLGLFNLMLYSLRNSRNHEKVNTNIIELTYISEMTMTIGLFLLTIGTFLGAIWANESWGRYWAWDPKETWALVSVLVYSVILHLRFIPGLNSKFVFNLVSFWGYSAILFTFFGVNFVLVGLHSYASGDGIGEIPSWIPITALIFALLSVFAFVKNRKHSSLKP